MKLTVTAIRQRKEHKMTKAEGKILIAQIESLKEAITAIDCTEALIFKTDYLEEIFYQLNSTCIKIYSEVKE